MLKQKSIILFKETNEALKIRHFRSAPAMYQEAILQSYIVKGDMNVLEQVCVDSPEVFKRFINLLNRHGASDSAIEVVSASMQKVFKQFTCSEQDVLFKDIVLELLELKIGQLEIVCCLNFEYQSKYYDIIAAHQGLHQISRASKSNGHSDNQSNRGVSLPVWETKLGLAECDLNVVQKPVPSLALKKHVNTTPIPSCGENSAVKSIWGSMLGL